MNCNPWSQENIDSYIAWCTNASPKTSGGYGMLFRRQQTEVSERGDGVEERMAEEAVREADGGLKVPAAVEENTLDEQGAVLPEATRETDSLDVEVAALTQDFEFHDALNYPLESSAQPTSPCTSSLEPATLDEFLPHAGGPCPTTIRPAPGTDLGTSPPPSEVDELESVCDDDRLSEQSPEPVEDQRLSAQTSLLAEDDQPPASAPAQVDKEQSMPARRASRSTSCSAVASQPSPANQPAPVERKLTRSFSVRLATLSSVTQPLIPEKSELASLQQLVKPERGKRQAFLKGRQSVTEICTMGRRPKVKIEVKEAGTMMPKENKGIKPAASRLDKQRNTAERKKGASGSRQPPAATSQPVLVEPVVGEPVAVEPVAKGSIASKSTKLTSSTKRKRDRKRTKKAKAARAREASAEFRRQQKESRLQVDGKDRQKPEEQKPETQKLEGQEAEEQNQGRQEGEGQEQDEQEAERQKPEEQKPEGEEVEEQKHEEQEVEEQTSNEVVEKHASGDGEHDDEESQEMAEGMLLACHAAESSSKQSLTAPSAPPSQATTSTIPSRPQAPPKPQTRSSSLPATSTSVAASSSVAPSTSVALSIAIAASELPAPSPSTILEPPSTPPVPPVTTNTGQQSSAADRNTPPTGDALTHQVSQPLASQPADKTRPVESRTLLTAVTATSNHSSKCRTGLREAEALAPDVRQRYTFVDDVVAFFKPNSSPNRKKRKAEDVVAIRDDEEDRNAAAQKRRRKGKGRCNDLTAASSDGPTAAGHGQATVEEDSDERYRELGQATAGLPGENESEDETYEEDSDTPTVTSEYSIRRGWRRTKSLPESSQMKKRARKTQAQTSTVKGGKRPQADDNGASTPRRRQRGHQPRETITGMSADRPMRTVFVSTFRDAPSDQRRSHSHVQVDSTAENKFVHASAHHRSPAPGRTGLVDVRGNFERNKELLLRLSGLRRSPDVVTEQRLRSPSPISDDGHYATPPPQSTPQNPPSRLGQATTASRQFIPIEVPSSSHDVHPTDSLKQRIFEMSRAMRIATDQALNRLKEAQEAYDIMSPDLVELGYDESGHRRTISEHVQALYDLRRTTIREAAAIERVVSDCLGSFCAGEENVRRGEAWR